MTDPAVEAVQRLNLEWPNNRAWALQGAREALKPIRELHKPAPFTLSNPDPAPFCMDCDQDWPCNTAKLIYTSEELER